MILQFDVINQRIIRKDNNYIVANSQFYLQMDFNFTYDWQGFGKTITFVSGTKKFSIGLNAQDSCVVPYEVIKTPSFLFSIRGELDDVVITTNIVTVPIQASGETHGIAPSDPPKEIFSGLQNGLQGQALYKLTDDNYDYAWGNLKEMSYDGTSTLGEVLDNLVVDAVTDVKYEDGFLKKVENNITTTIVEMYDKATIDEMLENLDKYIEKSETPGLIKNDGTIDETTYASQNDLDNAKNDLQGDIDTLDRELSQSISNEKTNRENADTRIEGKIDNHIADTNNPHNVTTTQLGLENVVNTGDSDTPVENGTTKFTTGGAYTLKNDLQGQITQEASDRATAIGNEKTLRENADISLQGNIDTHTSNKSNPHEVTKAQVGLGNVVNTTDSATPTAGGDAKFTTGGAYTLKNDLEQAISNEATTRSTNDDLLAGAISGRLCIVKMNNVVLNNWTDVGIPQEFENYSYVAVIRDTKIIGAESVNVLFTIEQILSDNYCPAPLVDNVEGTIKIFGNDDMTITIPSVEIFKEIEYTIPEEE